MGPRRLVHELERAGVVPVPARMSVYRTLVRPGLIEPKSRRRHRRDYRRWERDEPMALWQMDIVGGVMLTDGREVKIVTGVDDHSASASSRRWWLGQLGGRCVWPSPTGCAGGVSRRKC